MATKEGQFIPVIGPAMVRRGVGDPPGLKARFCRAVGLEKLETHISPCGLMATP